MGLELLYQPDGLFFLAVSEDWVKYLTFSIIVFIIGWPITSYLTDRNDKVRDNPPGRCLYKQGLDGNFEFYHDVQFDPVNHCLVERTGRVGALGESTTRNRKLSLSDDDHIDQLLAESIANGYIRATPKYYRIIEIEISCSGSGHPELKKRIEDFSWEFHNKMEDRYLGIVKKRVFGIELLQMTVNVLNIDKTQALLVDSLESWFKNFEILKFEVI